MGVRAWIANNVAVRGGINEVTVTDTPATGEVLTATGSTTASWQPGGGGGGGAVTSVDGQTGVVDLSASYVGATTADILALLPPSGFYGDGRSGDVTVPTGDPWCPMEPLFCDDLIIPAGATFEVGNFPLYVRGTLSGSGTIIIFEAADLDSTGVDPPGPDVYGAWRTGGTGGSGGTENGSNSLFGSPFTLSPGGAGGAGASGIGGTATGLTFADLKAEASNTNALELVLSGALMGMHSYAAEAGNPGLQGGRGGGGGGGDGVNAGGAGGNGNYGLLLCAATLNFTGTIDIRGGNGADAATGDCGGGGGGGGGFAHIVYRQKLVSYTALVDGGTGGAGSGTGTVGADGADGVVLEMVCY